MPIEFVRHPLSHSPEEVSARLSAWPDAALLESGPGFGLQGGWSFLSARPRLVFEMTGDRWSVSGNHPSETGDGDGLGRLARLLEEFRLGQPGDACEPDLPPFAGGMIGYFGYDLAPRLERLPRRAARDSRMPDARFALHDTLIAVNHADQSVTLFAFDLLKEGKQALESRAKQWLDAFEELPTPVHAPRLSVVEKGFSAETYQNTIRRCLDYIAAGDIFQVNLSQRFRAESDTIIDPAWLYQRLKRHSPAPFAGLLRWGDLAIVSASPELFYQTEGRRIVTRPIKGTRPRGASPDLDLANRNELLNSLKDRAELTMIVDLERNDLGRVCSYGSVKVSEPLTLESFAQVHHLVATVEGRLRLEIGPIDVVRAIFPGGSITGAPKIRAMEIIDELERNRRGVYTGAIGYYGTGGRSAFNIAIRTVLIEGRSLSFQVGGGIVADSSPELEYRETLHKAEGMRLALRAKPLGDVGC